MLRYELIHTVEQCAAACQTYAVLCNIACEFRRSLLKQGTDGLDDMLKGFLKRIDHFV